MLIYNSNGFLKYYTEHFSDTTVDESTLKELEEIRAEDLKTMRTHNFINNHINTVYDLNSLKNSLLNAKDKNDIEKILNKLDTFIRKTNFPISKKVSLYSKISDLYKSELTPPYLPILNIICELTDLGNTYNLSLPKILHRYRHILNKLKYEDFENSLVYRKLYINISDHIQYLKNINKENYELTLELQNLQEVIQQILDKPIYAEKLKRQIVSTVELILSICSVKI